jgi:hypothetical protein
MMATATERARIAPSSITILGSTGVIGYDVAHVVIGHVSFGRDPNEMIPSMLGFDVRPGP